MTTATETTPNFDVLLDVPVHLTLQLGHCQMPMRDVLKLNIGAVVPVDKTPDAPVDLFVNQKLVARGEVIVVDNRFGLKITELAGRRG
jgi:flagellar motor switch protein FliN/FliY